MSSCFGSAILSYSSGSAVARRKVLLRSSFTLRSSVSART
jgi:hypothetical protein